MRVAIFSGPEQVEITTYPDPTCGPDQVIIRVATCGICGTDLHIFRNEYFTTFPIVPGHEFCGEIVEIGMDVTNVRVGQRVAADPNIPCDACVFCRDGYPNLCLHIRVAGVTQAGAFAEYVSVPARVCFALPEGMSDTQAAFIEPLSCVVHALDRIRVRPADDVLVFGAGPIGLLLAQALRRSGAARVVLVERSPARLQLAESLGFPTIPADEHQAERLREIAMHGFPLVADATGNPAVIERALGYVRPAGTYLQFGVAAAQATVAWQPYDIFRRELTIIGTFAVCYSFERALNWLEQGIVQIEPLLSHTLPLAEFPSALAAFGRGETLKVHIRPND
jgi:2-desacetyl-2-hydroxyethyl bacteriochlorophyllide A dehydrogenase